MHLEFHLFFHDLLVALVWCVIRLGATRGYCLGVECDCRHLGMSCGCIVSVQCFSVVVFVSV